MRTPIYAEMVNLVNNKPVTFTGFMFDKDRLQSLLNSYTFTNVRTITKSMLAWWAFNNANQKLLSLESVFETEHIYAKNRYAHERSLDNFANVESLGNKSLLEKRINIRASDYRFMDKAKYYIGFENSRGQKKEGTGVQELLDLANTATDFTEKDIVERKARIIDTFLSFVDNNGLLA